jgi:hypothetical protein
MSDVTELQKSAESARNDLIRIQRWIAGNPSLAATPVGQKLINALLAARNAAESMMNGKYQ